MPKCLTDLLNEIIVHCPGNWENELTPAIPQWWAVSNDDGIIAYFGNSTDAWRFRLDYINRKLNP